MTRSPFDEDASRQLEAVYLTPDIVNQRRCTLQALALQKGEHVLDVGSGPGLLVADMARTVGPSGLVTGLDINTSMMRVAQRRCEPISSHVALVQGDATALPFPDEAFDVAVSTQVYEYIDDVAQALAEVYRILRPGGRILIIDTDWDSIVWNAKDTALMQRILDAWVERFADAHLPGSLSRLLADSGFSLRRRDVLVLLNPEYDVNTYSLTNGRILAKFVVGRRCITQHDVDAWKSDLRQLGSEGRYFFSLNRYLFVAEKPV